MDEHDNLPAAQAGLDRRGTLRGLIGVSLIASASSQATAQSTQGVVGNPDQLGRLPLDRHAYREAVASGIGERNTVSNGPDNGANNNVANRFWNCKRHGSTAQAVDNGLIATFLKIDPPGPNIMSAGGMNIGGHGNEGYLETGMGQSGPYNIGQFISWNEYNWGPQFDRLVTTSITMVSIWSCHTGAGDDGADLLFAIAKRVGRAVRARTGFMYSNNQDLWFENGSVWQVATPESRPIPISAPSPHLRATEAVRFKVGDDIVDAQAVDEFRAVARSFGEDRGPVRRITGSDAKQLVSKIFLESVRDVV